MRSDSVVTVFQHPSSSHPLFYLKKKKLQQESQWIQTFFLFEELFTGFQHFKSALNLMGYTVLYVHELVHTDI